MGLNGELARYSALQLEGHRFELGHFILYYSLPTCLQDKDSV